MEAILVLLAGLLPGNVPPGQAREQSSPVYLGKTALQWGEQLRESDSSQRRRAAEALGNTGPDARPVIERLLQVAEKDVDADVRAEAAWALCEMGVPAMSSIKTLIKCLNDKEVRVRRWAIRALAKDPRSIAARGGLPAMAIPFIAGNLDLPKEMQAIETARVRVPQVLPAFVEALKDPDPKVRQCAILGIEQSAPWADSAVPVLCKATKDSDNEVRYAAEQALLAMDPAEAERQGIKRPREMDPPEAERQEIKRPKKKKKQIDK